MVNSSNLFENYDRFTKLQTALYEAFETYSAFPDERMRQIVGIIEELIAEAKAEKNRLDDKYINQTLLLAIKEQVRKLPLSPEDWRMLKMDLPESVRYFVEDEWDDLIDSLSDCT
jgi:hypothetical protein